MFFCIIFSFYFVNLFLFSDVIFLTCKKLINFPEKSRLSACCLRKRGEDVFMDFLIKLAIWLENAISSFLTSLAMNNLF